MTSVRQALQRTTERLVSLSPSPRLDAEILLAHVLRVNRAYLLAEGLRSLTPAQLLEFRALVERRAALEPVAYIIGRKEFYGLDFYVDQRVLVPRPETELIVERALAWAKQHASSSQTIADIGTGSGALAVALAAHLPHAHVFAVDLSADALAVADINVQRHNLAGRIRLLHGDGCSPLPQPVDLIVSNPPYTVLAEVDENVWRWEPSLALDGGTERGFANVARLLRQMPPYLQPHGVVLVEIGAWQGTQALALAQEVFAGTRVQIHQDLAGHDRVLEVTGSA